ncbi:histidine kinase dimerization/phospho-acceptor domain-containing protein [Dactylosporangium sp. AC04546]|uniref:sensor histidine kinase n=1 Tax=Dactylosporangium sp. AC04546 TaxID=2862460 RepID=UPI001EE0729A|nr:histidine kinase dimerization/phospho-acceptor domain-containing protein [Dactylosporangium sp. AC04546]WVK82059.1 histidine kinase dimerization/phospho-acceptor domain-containing protein [Dactylosporangium sp. AC04546]
MFSTGDDDAARMRHELHTPLTAILACTRLLRDDPGVPGEGVACLDAIDRNAMRLERYVDAVVLPLAATGGAAPRAGATDLVAVLRDAVDLARRVAVAGGVSVHADVPDTVPVAADEMVCRHLVGQLMLWLATAAPARAHIAVTLRRDPGPAIDARIVPHAELTPSLGAAPRRPADDAPAAPSAADLRVARAVAALCGGDVRLDETSFRLTLPATVLAPSAR